MLDTLCYQDIASAIGQPCMLTDAFGNRLALTLRSARENPAACHPYAGAERRVPFSLQLAGPVDCPCGDGLFTLQLLGLPEISGVFASRVMNIAPEPASVFQIVFN